MNPMNHKISRMDCCCNFGKSWGEYQSQCEDCPRPNTKEHQDLCSSVHSGANEIRDACGSNTCPNGKCIPDTSQQSGYYCECDSGFEKDRNGNCQDINECRQGLCSNGVCRNKEGSFECQCPSGFHLSSDGMYVVLHVNQQDTCTRTEQTYWTLF